MAPSPLVSAVLPVFNGERFLQQAIASILEQRFGDFELIVVDDGSTDSTATLIHSFTDHRIRYFHQANAGIGAALRQGCSLADGRYIARMDADDVAEPERFEIQVTYLEKNPGCVLTSCGVTYIDAEGRELARSFPYVTDNVIRKRLMHFNPVCHPGIMMRREAYEKTPGYRSLEPFEDHILWLSLMRLGSFHNDSRALLRYRYLPDSLSRMLPAIRQAALFRHLKGLHFSGKLDETAIIEFRAKVAGEKKNIPDTASVQEPSPASGVQWSLYRMMRRAGLSENTAAAFISNLKSVVV